MWPVLRSWLINPSDCWRIDSRLKKRTHRLGDSDDAIDKALDALAWVLNTADVPGTMAWADMDLEHRVDWWVRRVGALDTLLVAYPGVLCAEARFEAGERAQPEPSDPALAGRLWHFAGVLWAAKEGQRWIATHTAVATT